jgi:thiamine-phosphate pyrophosphorylase
VSRRSGRGHEPAEGGPWLDPAEERSRLLLFAVPPEAVLGSGAVAALVLPAAAIDAHVLALRRRWRLPLLVQGDAAAAENEEVDGVHLAGSDAVAAARQLLGRGRLIGADCGHSRHAAMVAGEAGADYVQFGSLDLAPPGAVIDLVAWWRELFVLPCAAAGRFSPASAQALVAARADFLATREPDAELAQALLSDGIA